MRLNENYSEKKTLFTFGPFPFLCALALHSRANLSSMDFNEFYSYYINIHLKRDKKNTTNKYLHSNFE